MKTRNGFVSNSSTSSFIVSKKFYHSPLDVAEAMIIHCIQQRIQCPLNDGRTLEEAEAELHILYQKLASIAVARMKKLEGFDYVRFECTDGEIGLVFPYREGYYFSIGSMHEQFQKVADFVYVDDYPRDDTVHLEYVIEMERIVESLPECDPCLVHYRDKFRVDGVMICPKCYNERKAKKEP